jgi:hypothetical protein
MPCILEHLTTMFGQCRHARWTRWILMEPSWKWQIFGWLHVQCVNSTNVPIDKCSNNKLWKLKIPLRIKVNPFFSSIWDNKTSFFQYHFACSIWSVIQLTLTLYLPCSIANIFEKWLHAICYRRRRIVDISRTNNHIMMTPRFDNTARWIRLHLWINDYGCSFPLIPRHRPPAIKLS